MGPIFVGTIIWLIVGLLVGWRVIKHVDESSPVGKGSENKKIAYVALIMAGLSMWAMWACCYMHQMYPLLKPKMEM